MSVFSHSTSATSSSADVKSTSAEVRSVDIAELLRAERIVTYFQPIASVRRQDLLGVEALSRGVDENGKIVPPQLMFGAAEDAGVACDLDRLCRKRALEAFAALHRAHPQWILFLNIHASALIVDLDGEHSIENLARTHGIDTRNIALEILETEFKDTQALRVAVQTYRTAGFLVVLDDVGAGHANLDRIAFVRPDMIKADAAILFPVFARARENARRASCSSNLKQIGLGLLQYVQDYDEQMVNAYYPYQAGGNDGFSNGASNPPRYKWMDAVQP